MLDLTYFQITALCFLIYMFKKQGCVNQPYSYMFFFYQPFPVERQLCLSELCACIKPTESNM